MNTSTAKEASKAKTAPKAKTFAMKATPLMELLNERFNQIHTHIRPAMTHAYTDLCRQAARAYAEFWKSDSHAYKRMMHELLQGYENPLEILKDFNSRLANRQAATALEHIGRVV